jgi:cysteine desulfurase
VLTAIGVDADTARTAVRFTFPRSLRDDLSPVADAVRDAVAAVSA